MSVHADRIVGGGDRGAAQAGRRRRRSGGPPVASKVSDSEFDGPALRVQGRPQRVPRRPRAQAPAHSLQDLIAFNERHKDREMPYFGQEIFLQAEKTGPLTDPKYKAALANGHQWTRTLGIDAVTAKYRLDALRRPDERSGVAHRPRQRRLRPERLLDDSRPWPATRTSPCRPASPSACRSAFRSSGRRSARASCSATPSRSSRRRSTGGRRASSPLLSCNDGGPCRRTTEAVRRKVNLTAPPCVTSLRAGRAGSRGKSMSNLLQDVRYSRPPAVQEPRVLADGHPGAGARHRRERRRLHAGQHALLPADAGQRAPGPDRRASTATTTRSPDSYRGFSYPAYIDIRDRSRSFSQRHGVHAVVCRHRRGRRHAPHVRARRSRATTSPRSAWT